MVARYQPAKLAAMEALFETRAAAPLTIGGIPEAEVGRGPLWRRNSLWAEPVGPLTIRMPSSGPEGLSARRTSQCALGPSGVPGHGSIGSLLIALGLGFWWVRWRRPFSEARWLLRALAPARRSFHRLEAGWFLTELGRQPWTVYGLMRTSNAVTPVADVPSLVHSFTALYFGLAVALVVLLLRLASGTILTSFLAPSATRR